MRQDAATLLLASGLALQATAPALASDEGMRFGLSRGPASETYAPEALSLRISSFERYHLGWRWQPAMDTRVLLTLSRGGYSIADPDFPGTIHQRTETEGLVGGMLAYEMLGGALGLGVGYAARLVEVMSGAKAPGTDPAFLFAPWQVFHGVAFLADYRRPLFGPFGLALDAAAMPHGFAQLGDSRLALPSFWSVSLNPRITFWGDRAAIGYRYERTYSAVYGREAGVITASFALSGF
ncbi:MAG TPA: hypothetical protein V6D00_14985 [Pantanalinema sp.]